MNKKDKKISLISVLVLIPFILLIFNATIVKSLGTQLNLNQPNTYIYLSSFSKTEEFYINAPEGKLYVKAYDFKYTTLIMNMSVSNDAAYSNIIDSKQNILEQDVTIEITLTSAKTLYIKTEWISGSGSFDLVVNDESSILGPQLINILLIALVVGLGCLSVLSITTGLKKLKREVEGAKYELETDKPIPMTYKFLLKTYSGIQNLNILNAVENQLIETELRQVGIGYYTTTHYSSSGSGHSYSSTRPYTYVIRYNALIELQKRDGKTVINMKLKTGKLHLSALISTVMFLIMALVMGIIFSFIPFMGAFWVLPVLIMTGMALMMSLIMPRSIRKSYLRTAGDQFQLLIKKPVISLQMGTEDAIQALQIASIDKREAKVKATAHFCPFCGKTVPEGVQICENCGAELE